MGEKTEKPTEKRRRDRRKEGQVIKSNEITSGVQLAAILLFWHLFAEAVIERTSTLIVLSISLINRPFLFAFNQLLHVVLSSAGLLFALFGGMLALATVGSVLLQIGFVLASKAVGIKGRRINPVSNLKQIFSLHSLVELCKSTGKVVVLTLIFAGLFYYYATTFQALPFCNSRCALPLFTTFTRWMWFGLIGFYIVLGVLDYAFQAHNTLKQQRMSKEEVKQEYKDAEGDPYMKQRRHEMQHEIQSGSLAHNVKRSAVVIRNPTHIAICLGYHPIDMPVPRVLDKGTAERAGQIVDLAQRAAVPVVENIPLARALFQHVGCGDRIPETLFEPVAVLLRMVLEIDYHCDEKTVKS
ncbi:Yop proteins translocation protein U [Sodalis glossinidius str. 'morsitans']|uniref:Type III secretion apparatus n=1 Tax=Sodalis glossinidius (strain morsitans) TaxID=343509 RepID=Q2NTE2_SODGM|nr:EscU/YscU/HrcU family type III secretion system export apparatus switch protein [Sodalis glossinidius]BAE74583.1 putative type III secretion apparatus [Sodalis glossinidius str. 'morsitans']CRL45304.1 Yop proteins translocation protein U [Sodalis glossinidius str. 'morsitans']